MNYDFSKVDKAEGWCWDNEAEKLAELAQDKQVLEIGSYQGRSAIAIAQTCKKLVCVDSWKGDGYTGPRDQVDLFSKFWKNTEEFHDKIIPMMGDFHQVLPLLKGKRFDFVYYDADHTGPTTEWALKWAHDYQHDAILAAHDYADDYPEYHDAYVAITEMGKRYRGFEVVGRLAIMTP